MTRKVLFPILAVSFAVALVVALWPRGEAAAGAEGPVAARDAVSPALRESAIRRVYAAYAARSAAAGGEPVEVALDDFRTVGADAFDEVAFFPDLATLSADWELAAVIEVRVEEGQPERDVRFRPRWRPVEQAPPAELLGRAASEIVGPGGDHFASRRAVEALTSYRVRVLYDGLEQTYRAAAIWRHDADRALAFAIADNVMPEVALAVDDGEGSGSLLGDRHSVAGPEPPRWEIGGGQCTPRRTVLRLGQPGSVRAVTSPPPSDDRPSYVGTHACSCAADCSARCEAAAEATYDGCRAVLAESTSELRQRAVAVAYVVDQSTPPGVAARCSAGLTCDLLDCADGLCGNTWVRLEPGPDGLRLDVAGGTAGGTGNSHDFVCGRCTPST